MQNTGGMGSAEEMLQKRVKGTSAKDHAVVVSSNFLLQSCTLMFWKSKGENHLNVI